MIKVCDLIDILRHAPRYAPVVVSGDSGQTTIEVIDAEVSEAGELVIHFWSVEED